MRFWRVAVLFGIAVLLAAGIYSLFEKKKSLQREAANLRTVLEKTEEENERLVLQIEYFNRPENLLKELKSQFNYVEAGEKLIVIISKTGTSSSDERD